MSHKRTWTVRIPDISDEGFLSRRIFLHLLGMLGIWPEPSAQQKNEIKNVKNWKHMQKPSVPVTVIFRRFIDDTGSPVVECCLKPVVPSVQKVFVPSENVIAPLQSLHRRQSMTLLGSTLQIQQPDFKLFQDTVSPTRHERYRKTSKECKCPVLNANGC